MAVFDNYDELAKSIVLTTYNLAKKSKHNPVDVEHLFFVLINQSSNAISELLKQGGADIDAIRQQTKGALAGLLSVQEEFSMSEELNDAFTQANQVTKVMGDKQVSIYHLFLGLLKSKNEVSAMLHQQGITFKKMQSIVAQMEKSKINAGQEVDSTNDSSLEVGSLEKYSEDLTQLAREGKLKTIIGREQELKKLVEILSRKEKNNVVILGESGVGKTALAELFAQKIVAGEVPESFKDKKILSINLGSLIGGTKFRGEFEEKISNIIKMIKGSEGKIILFIDEFHNISGAGKGEGSMGLSDMLKPELSSGALQIIGATTTSEYRLNIEKDTALTRRFETITLQEPNLQDAVTILRGIAGGFEKHHGVTIYDSALVSAVELSNRYITDRKLPDKAINVLDQAATKVKIAMTSLPESVTKIVIKISELTQERESITQELAITKDLMLIQEYSRRCEEIVKNVSELQVSYESKKSDRGKIKKIFEENRALEVQNQNFEKQIKEAKGKSDFENISKDINGKIGENQKKIESNKGVIILLQSQSGITIKSTVEREDIAQVISEKTGIPLTKMIEEESQKLANLEEYLSTKVVGQPEAVVAISDAIRRARVGLKDPKKPIGSFIFLGPTGVGKTELAKALTEFLFFDKKALIRLNMSEYQEKSAISKIIGSDPGLIGYDEGGQLTEKVKRNPYSVVLLDEMEKAHPNVFDLFLQVLDDGMLNNSSGETIDFKNTIIIMTSNIGSHEIMEKLQGPQEDIGDIYPVENDIQGKELVPENSEIKKKRNRRPKKKNTENEGEHGEEADILNERNSKIEELKEEIKPILTNFFRPEFLNRLTGSFIFNPISVEMLKSILEIKIKEQSNLFFSTNKITLTISNEAKNFLAKKSRDPANGARPIDRALEVYITNPLAKEIVSGRVNKGDAINISFQEGKLVFKK